MADLCACGKPALRGFMWKSDKCADCMNDVIRLTKDMDGHMRVVKRENGKLEKLLGDMNEDKKGSNGAGKNY